MVLTWPTVSRLTTHLPGDGGDDPAIAWNLWWVKYALLDEGRNPFQSDFIFYPIGVNLAFYTLTLLNAVTALPVTLNLGVVAASNLHMFFTFACGGYGVFLLTRYVLTTTLPSNCQPEAATRRLIWLCAAIAGGFYAFASNKLFYVALGQFNIASAHWLPYAVLYLLHSHYQPRQLKNPVLAALFLTFQAWTEITYASFLVIFMILYWFYWALNFGLRFIIEGFRASPKTFLPGLSLLTPHLRAVVMIGLTFTLGLAPILAQMLPEMQIEGDFLVEGSGFAEAFSADLFGYVVPTMRHPLLGDLVRQTSIAGFDKGQHIYIGFTLLLLALLTIRAVYRQPTLRFWFIAAMVFALLCLGPVITINGHTTAIEGPFRLLQDLPFFKGNRYPSRYSVLLLLCLTILAGYSLLKISRWLQPANWPATALTLILISALFLFEHLSLPLPQSDMRPPPAYRVIAADPGNFTVLDIPFAWRNGFRITGALTTQFMFGQFYQTTHQKKLLQGNTSRNPEFKFQYFTNAPIINSLLALETGKNLPPEQWTSDRAIAAGVLYFFNIKYIIVRPYSYIWSDGLNRITVTQEAVTRYIEDVFPIELISDEAAIKLYRVNQETAVPSELLIHSDNPLTPLYLGEGWGLLSQGRPMTAQRRETRLLAPLTATPQRVTFRIRLPEPASTGDSSTFSLNLNGWQSGAQTIEPDWREVMFEIPSTAIRPGLNDIYLRFSQSFSLPSPDLKLVAPLDITVLSAGYEVGDFGHIFVNGYEVSPNQRGYNIVVLQPDLAQAHFDTNADPNASQALSQYLANATKGDLLYPTIALAAADEASVKLSQEAVLALQSIGGRADLRGCFRCSHALISQNSNPGRYIIEAMEPFRPVGVTTHLGLTEPRVAAIIDWIRIEPISR